MSKISLAPDASGTGIFTIASPNSNTNRTLTLPDDTGTIVTDSGNQAGSFTTLNTSGAVVFNDAGADVDFRVEGDTDANLLFVDASTDRVGIGTSSPGYKFEVVGGTGTNTIATFRSGDGTAANNAGGGFASTSSSTAGDRRARMWLDADGANFADIDYFAITKIGNSGNVELNNFSNAGMLFFTNNVSRMSIASGGAVNVVGALSKGSGSFKIDHPLKPETHHLIHSFIEGPQADLIYRGKAELVDGRAEVNIDTVAGMTEGTFVALNREVQCFTSNESDWDAVRGSVTGNILTIECQNAESTATISWMVIGERQDQHMYDTDWTDENGKVIVEPLKPVEEVVAPTEEPEVDEGQ